MNIIYLALVSFVFWFISTLAGGGSPLILTSLINLLLDSQAVVPVVTTGMLLGNYQRIFLFWQDIEWQVTLWYFPGAIAGATLGAYVFTKIQLKWLQLLIILVFVITVVGYWLGKKYSFTVHAWQFLPVGFLYSFISGLIGSTGSAVNPFYLNYGLVKEQMIATKAANIVVIHVVKIVTYAAFGALTTQYLGYGLIIGLTAVPANCLGQYVLSRMNNEQFTQLVFAVTTISTVLLLWQREFIAFL